MGFVSEDVGTVWLVERHLLLRDVAARRDIDDLVTAEQVANQVGSVDRLRSLAALTEADGLATSDTAWDPWTSHQIARLVERVERVLLGSGADGRTIAAFPSDEQLTRLMDGERRIEVSGDVVT